VQDKKRLKTVQSLFLFNMVSTIAFHKILNILKLLAGMAERETQEYKHA